MTMIPDGANVFPTLSTKQDEKNFQDESENPAISSKTEGGYVITRARFTRTPRRTFAVAYSNLSTADKTLLVNFWNQLGGGSDTFWWTHPATGEIIQVRFDPSKTLQFEYARYQQNPDGTPDHRWNMQSINVMEV